MKTHRRLKFEYGQNDAGNFYWHVKAGNREIVCQGEGYERKAGILGVYRALFEAAEKPALINRDAGLPKKPRLARITRRSQGTLNRPWP